ncbi:ORF6N domain-containing protein [Clostridium perfringens]|uniref:ORF6N domain-containing protein n=1 Tax=Clostridium perfringens TaxID=1502 RepID=UPI003B026343
MNNLVLKEKQEFMGIQIPVIEGGFGENQKVMLAKTIAEIHDMDLRKVNELINNNIDEFEKGIDILDLKGNKNFAVLAKDSGLYTQNSINASSNIYLLSEQGYMALVGLMRTDKAKEIRRKLRREYFAMKAELKTGQSKQIKPNLKEKEIETKNNNSFARVLNALNKILKNPSSSEEAKKEANIKLEEFLSGKSTDIKVLGRKTFSASDIGKKLGVSSQKIGRLSEAHNLKTDEFGEWFKDKSRYSKKEVPSFRYYENAIPVFKGLLSSKGIEVNQIKLDV